MFFTAQLPLFDWEHTRPLCYRPIFTGSVFAKEYQCGHALSLMVCVELRSLLPKPLFFSEIVLQLNRSKISCPVSDSEFELVPYNLVLLNWISFLPHVDCSSVGCSVWRDPTENPSSLLMIYRLKATPIEKPAIYFGIPATLLWNSNAKEESRLLCKQRQENKVREQSTTLFQDLLGDLTNRDWVLSAMGK